MITRLGSAAVRSRDDLERAASLLLPGESVPVDIRRGGAAVHIVLRLDGRIGRKGPDGHTRPFYPPTVLEHDGLLSREEFGTPVVRLDGRAVGVNVGRTVDGAVAVPAAAARAVAAELRSGKGRVLWEAAAVAETAPGGNGP